MPDHPPERIDRRVSRALARLFALLLCGSPAERAGGAVLRTAGDIPAAQILGAAQTDTVWVRGQAVGTVTLSGTLIRGRDADYVITAAHGVRFTSGTFSPNQVTVGNGTSYTNDPGATTSASSIYVSPTYVPGSNTGLDYAFIRLENRISTDDLFFRIGATPSLGETVLFSGFGIPATLSGEQVPNTGSVMGFFANFFHEAVWNSANDSAFTSASSNSGYASSRDSGGSAKAFNPSTGQWDNLGIMVGASNQYTIFFNFNNADQAFNNYLTNVVQPVTAPTTPPLITVTTNSTHVQISCADLVPAREYSILHSATHSRQVSA